MTLFTVMNQKEPISLRNFLKKNFEQYSTREIERLLSLNGCEVNNAQQRFGSTKLREGDSVKVMPSFLNKGLKKKVSIPILYQDEDLFVIDKPAGLSSALKDLQPHFQDPIFLVHRLDKMTSGVLILARNENAKSAIEKLFFNREIDKTYLAITHGRIANATADIDQPIKLKKRYQGGVIYQAAPFGKKAKTFYKRLALGKSESFLLLKPHTGRTHQIRVHLSSLEHPIIGDALYTAKPISPYRSPSMLLHAYKIKFVHPINGKNIAIIAPIPLIMNQSISKLFKKHKICAF